ncbi:MAG TPA: membrane protein insertion efficiency factor YidD [Dongiaceae bacterium]|nr:membrane protein insertion efficiency factor YidD [Candidatus Saccharimonadales bacterium]HYV50474.1 membrane protein insertion efficiency factor YidD [Dongiaceae bacterium]
MSDATRSIAPFGLRWLLVSLVRLYRFALSPVLPRACRFEPSCAAYAEEALSRRPLPRALWLVLKRLSKCHPFHPGGYDPVP